MMMTYDIAAKIGPLSGGSGRIPFRTALPAAMRVTWNRSVFKQRIRLYAPSGCASTGRVGCRKS
jgi:hypothetical protein